MMETVLALSGITLADVRTSTCAWVGVARHALTHVPTGAEASEIVRPDEPLTDALRAELLDKLALQVLSNAMTADKWERCPDARPMLNFLRDRAGRRKLRLFACAMSRLSIRLLVGLDGKRLLREAEDAADEGGNDGGIVLPIDMLTEKDQMPEILLHAYAPPLTIGDPRPELVARAVETQWPGVRLLTELAKRGRGRFERVLHAHDRADYLSSEIEQGTIPFITNPEEDFTVSLTGLLEPDAIASGGKAQLHVVVEMPAETRFLASSRAGLAAVASVLQAHWATLSLSDAHAVMTEQYVHDDSGRRPPHGLPALLPWYELDGPDLPHWLAWLNYWSAACAERLSFPRDVTDQEWLRFASCENDAWLLQLAHEPLDLAVAEHVLTLRRAYDRFLDVGRAIKVAHS